MDGRNIADFVDPDILEKLEALEAEEEAQLASEDGERRGRSSLQSLAMSPTRSA